jgi:hypothetical protein
MSLELELRGRLNAGQSLYIQITSPGRNRGQHDNSHNHRYKIPGLFQD